MINFIIYDDSLSFRNIYKSIIRGFMGDLVYHIFEFNYFNEDNYIKVKNIMGKKIFVIDDGNKDSLGLKIAESIRNDDWNSQIVVLTKGNDYVNFTTRLLKIDVISKEDNFSNNFYIYLNMSFKILCNCDVLAFRCDGEIFQLLYNDIYYIEKNLNDNDSTIVTKCGKFVIKSSLNKIMKSFGGDPRFFKCHRSCIVNLNNILCFDINNNIIKFRDGQINLISRDKRKQLKEKIINDKIVL